MKNGVCSLYLLFGEESYLTRHYTSLLVEKSVEGGFDSFSFHAFDGRSCSVQDIADAAECFPLMGGKSCVLVTDLALDTLPQDSLNVIFALADDPPEHCVTVFSIENLEVDLKRNAKWRKIIDRFSKNGQVLNFERRSRKALCDILVKGAARRDCVLDARLADYLIGLAGDDMNSLLNELDKLCAFTGSGDITKEAVDLICVKSLDASAFDLARQLVSGSFEKAYATLDTLFRLRIEPVIILGALINIYIDMYRAKVALISGAHADEAAKFFNYKNKEFRLRNAARDSSDLSVNALRLCLDELAKADETIKSSNVDRRIVFEKLMVKLALLRSA